MSLYQNKYVRVPAPRDGEVKYLACNATTNSLRLDNTICALTATDGTSVPGSSGRVIVRFRAEGADLGVLLGNAQTVVANLAATSGNTVCDRIPDGQERDYELNPQHGIQLWVSARTSTGTGVLRYRLVSDTTNHTP